MGKGLGDVYLFGEGKAACHGLEAGYFRREEREIERETFDLAIPMLFGGR